MAAVAQDQGIVALAAAGDEVAFAQLVRLHQADMARVCFVICGELDIADEAVEAGWAIAWRKLATLRDHGLVRSWLISIAANEARQLVRRRGRRRLTEIPMPLEAGSHDPDPARRAGDLDLANALARLKPEDRAILALRYLAGFNSTELAAATGMSAGGVRARLARLLDGLRRELGDD